MPLPSPPTHANYQLFSIHQTDEFSNIILSVKPFLTTAHLNIILLSLHSFLDVPPAQGWKNPKPIMEYLDSSQSLSLGYRLTVLNVWHNSYSINV